MPILKVKYNGQWEEVLGGAGIGSTSPEVTVNNISADAMGNIELDKSNIGIYVTQTEPIQVTDGDIWIDTSGTPADSGNAPAQTGVEVTSNSNAANLYVWRRNEGLENTYLLTISAAMRLHSWDIFPGVGSEPQIKGYYADSISVVDNAIFLNDATEVALSGVDSYEVTKGKYLSINSNVYKIAENATFSEKSQFTAAILVGYYIECSDCQMCSPAGGYVSSNLRTTYPDNGQGSDGNNYKYLGQLGQQLNNQIPFFDLVTLGLPAITMDGNEVSLECDTSKIRAALAINSIKIRYQITNDSSTFTYTTIANPSYGEEIDAYQLLFMGIVRTENNLYAGLLHFDIFTTGIKAFFYPSQY